MPHDRQRYFCTPSPLLPSLTTSADPQWAHLSMRDALTMAASSAVSLRCFSEYHSETVESTKASAGEKGLPSRFGYDFKEPARGI